MMKQVRLELTCRKVTRARDVVCIMYILCLDMKIVTGIRSVSLLKDNIIDNTLLEWCMREVKCRLNDTATLGKTQARYERGSLLKSLCLSD
jgi:hypothetical protein